MIELEIDGKKVQTEPGSMIIEAADNAGIYIPRFCYHKKLSIAANCRMCLVDVEKSPKPVPACATPVNDGMKVQTKSKNALEAQKYVMEFLLINHPLDCPICDQGGECELQDISMGFGRDDSNFTEAKRSVDDEDLGSLIASDMTRCIQCTRCVRFGQEIAGVPELGLLGRSNSVQISTYVKNTLKSELSGNIIDLCPVGALTSKPYRFSARAWELTQHAAIAPHDCLGSNLYLHTRREKVMRAVPHDNEAINETWISDRDRFSYLGLNHADRLAKPMIKHQGEWQEVDWTKAFEYAAKGLKEIIRESGADKLAGLISPNSSTEEGYLFQKILRELGCENIDYRIQQQDFSDDKVQALLFEPSIEDFSSQDRIFLIGSNVRREQPIFANRIHSSVENYDANVCCVNPYDIEFNFPIAAKAIVHPHAMVDMCAQVAKALGAMTHQNTPAKIKASLADVNISAEAKAIAENFNANADHKKLIVLGALTLNHPNAAMIRALARVIAKLTGAKIAELPAGANNNGLNAVGVKPTTGLNAYSSMQKLLQAYVLFNIEPEFDFANPYAAQHALEKAGFVVAFTAYQSPALLAHADILLPIVPFAETDATYVNIENTWQTMQTLLPSFAEARPGWKVLRVFANMLQLPGYQYGSAAEILAELKNYLAPQDTNEIFDVTLNLPTELKLTRITEWPLYRSDAIVRRAEALQRCGGNEACAVHVNQRTAENLKIANAAKVRVRQALPFTEVPLTISAAIPDNCVYVANAYPETSLLGESFGSIEIEK